MAHKKFGIFYNGITALGVEVEGSGSNIRTTFYEPAEDMESNNHGLELLMSLCDSMGSPKAPALALGGNLYMSHDHRSEFEDIQQAAQTLKFDIEDVLAVDAEKIATCFQEKPTNSTNIDMIVYTAERSKLQEIFEQLESSGSDPFAAMPSVVAWQKYLSTTKQVTSSPTAYIGRCGSTVYLMVFNSHGEPVISRKFPDVDNSKFYQIIEIELNRCSITIPSGESLTNLYYHSENISEENISSIAKDLGLNLQTIAEPSFAKAAAIGAALSIQKGKTACNFRADNLEPVSIKKSRKNALYAMSALASLIIISWIGIMAINTGKYRQMEKDATSYIKEAGRFCRVKSRKIANLHQDIERERDRIKKVASGQNVGNANSATNTMNLTLKALSRLNPEFDLVVNTMAFKPGEVKVFSGHVPDIDALKQLRDVLQSPESGLEILHETTNTAPNLQMFHMPMSIASPNMQSRRSRTRDTETEEDNS